ncbi:RNase adapter RapZ [Syntrophorhabdus aromaticivorans]|uniref:RNase adapter RapZ n=1 Tax=Syntrophorhabdus aromaticivorans TaxID=328301 RepID=A0A971RZK1_9BACT|nr:RNase adapter RapZ [Syntrophorhabdus aromaticivorans]NLW34036.1 RNase adapter RapZ [Syntrophorhabdus aromaticivorans]
MKMLILSGMSGSGKTTFLRALEDTGFFCVDNFPLILIEKFSELLQLTGDRITKVALVVDIREKEFFEEWKHLLIEAKQEHDAEIVFLESSDEAILTRFRETRRSHPIPDTSTVKEAVKEERRLLGWIKEIADRIIDTSQFTPHELRRFVRNTFGDEGRGMKINLMSFGFANGLPIEADMVLDVRFLPNPYFVDELREKTGLSDEIKNYMHSNGEYKKYLEVLLCFLGYLIPLYEKEGKSYLTISIGCTGGKHRSVAIVDELADHLVTGGRNVSTIHRDVDR